MILQSAFLPTTASLPGPRAAPQLPSGAAGARSAPQRLVAVAARQRREPSGLGGGRGTPHAAAPGQRPGLGKQGREAEHGIGRVSRALDVRCGAGRRWFETEGPAGPGGGGQAEFGPFPWQQDFPGAWVEPDEGALEVVTLVTSEGVYRLPSRGRAAAPAPGEARRPRREEKEYMDPHQQLCLGAVFDIKAINGVSSGRYFRVDGFCRSVQMLNDVIAEAVEEEGGEILCADVSSTGGLHERLHLKVVMPLLWGVPARRDTLRKAIHEGGGIVHRCVQEWQFM